MLMRPCLCCESRSLQPSNRSQTAKLLQDKTMFSRLRLFVLATLALAFAATGEPTRAVPATDKFEQLHASYLKGSLLPSSTHFFLPL